MAKASKNKVLLADGTIFQLDETANSFIAFNSSFNALPVSPRSGYDKYWNNNGFTNPHSRKKLKPQGVGKLLAQLGEQAYEIISRGGKPAEEMKAVLAGFSEYLKVVPELVAQQAAETLEATTGFGDAVADAVTEAVAATEVAAETTETATPNTESETTAETETTEAVVEKAVEAVPVEPIAADAVVADEVATPQTAAADVVADVAEVAATAEVKAEEPTEENTAPTNETAEPEAVEVELLSEAK